MLDSDVDSWYEWKRGDGFNESLTGMTTNDVQLIGSRSLNHLQSDDHRKEASTSNGLISYDAISTSSRFDPQVRFINPAIYAETLNSDEDEEQEIEIRVKVSSKEGGRIGNHGDFTQMNDAMTTLSLNNDLETTSFVDHAGDQGSAKETYRCYSLNSPSVPTPYKSDVVRSKSVTSCRPSSRVERRCKIVATDNNNQLCSAREVNSEVQRERDESYDVSCKYTLNGHRFLRVSTTSLSTVRISESRSNNGEFMKGITYSEWIRRKQEVIRRKKEEEELAEKKKQMEAERLAREKEEREERERENFLKWTERKKREEERKKAMIEKELELQKQLKEVEDKAAVVKDLHLRQWARKKKEEEKARRKKEEMKQKQLDEEKQKRLEESTKAYENWRKMAKNKPKPATQGLLPHQKAKPAYINPTPWQRIIDDTEDAEEDELNSRKVQSQPRINTKRNVTYD